ncbi:hypothetical protein O988_09254 [Pseudogymnoascus sp. VKM F-3808]|nr:hypothetical protein O988_09254 [Pseudogymnoascus sp. VKM F-3808]
MQLSTIIAVLLPVAAVLAAPTTPVDAAITEAIPAVEIAAREGESAGLVDRSTQTCKIIGSGSSVKCRYGPGTDHGIDVAFERGSKWQFSCYEIGECIYGNCTWDYSPMFGCYVSGYYTDSNCSMAARQATPPPKPFPAASPPEAPSAPSDVPLPALPFCLLVSNLTKEPLDDPVPLVPSSGQRSQLWTLDGYPIVDGKYHDLATDTIKTHTGPFRGGPPSVSVYWQNRGGSNRHNLFHAVGAISSCKVTDYLVRVGEMLKARKCIVSSLNATEYAVNVIVETELSTGDFTALLRDHGLLASSS